MAKGPQESSERGVVLEPIIHLWVTRILVPLGGYRKFVESEGFGSDALAEALGLREWLSPRPESFDRRVVQTELRALHCEAEKRFAYAKVPARLRQNVFRLAGLVGLSPVDCRVLEFAVLIHCDQLLDDAADSLGQMTSAKVFHLLAVILNVPEPEIRASLSGGGILARSGLVSIDRNGSCHLRLKLDLLTEGFADEVFSGKADPVSLLRGVVVPGGVAQLGLSDFRHIDPSLEILCAYLRHAVQAARSGVNIFLHGPPGTGKTQLVRTLARELGCDLFEVASEDVDGDPVGGERRLRAFRAAQCFFGKSQRLMVFDEVEEVFNDGDRAAGRKSTAQRCKAWINRMLEGNPVPTIWLSNSAALDAAFIRRFDMVLELPVPPKAERERILRERCADLLDSVAIARIAELDGLAPATVVRAGDVARSIQLELGQGRGGVAFERLICNTLQAQGHPTSLPADSGRLPGVYDPAFIHADADLAQVASGLTRFRSGRLCLYGPPGTGKSAYGRWLASQLGMPLLIKRASDLMSMWAGKNEQNIAQAFRQAGQDDAVLLIDEVDSFLLDRRNLSAEWELRLVNEMLVQMESFAGVFIASTNLMHGLDQSALRRFDIKVRFDFLRPAQACALLCRYGEQLGFSIPDETDLLRLRRLHQLTPGDFAAVMRQHRFRPLESPAQMVAALEAECALKEGARQAIGFV